MKEKVAGAANKVKGFFGKLSKKTRVFLGVGLGLVLVLLVAAAVFMSNQPYTPLFTGLTAADTQAILSYLDQEGVSDYKVQNGDTVLVRSDREAQLKASLIMAGYPKSGFGYEFYTDHVGSLSTDADRQNALLFDLQDRLSAVVRCLDGVRDAHVTINMGEDSRFILNSDNTVKATATVMVIMEPGATLTNEQATAIRNMISKSVKGLEVGEVEIADSMGNTYNGGTAGQISDASELRLYLEERESNKARAAILQVLTPLFGEDNVKVAVSCTVDVSSKIGQSTTYTSPEGTEPGQGIIGRRVWTDEIVTGAGAAAGGTVGTDANADIPTYVQNNMGVNGDNIYASTSGEEDSKVNSNTEQTERLAGVVTDMMVSVTINGTTAGNVDTTQLSTHIATAASITPEQREGRISILVQPFYQPEVVPPTTPELTQLPPWAIYAGIGGIALFVILLILFLILRGKSKKRKRQQAQRMIEEAGLTFMPDAGAPMGADIMTIRNEKSMELRKDIRQFAENNPEIAAQLVKSWLRGGEDGNG